MMNKNKGGRPRHDPPLTQAIHFRLEQALFDNLHVLAHERQLATQELIRRVLRAELRRQNHAG